ncbi:MAG: ATP-binding protein [Planctomycetaceae bacterium]
MSEPARLDVRIATDPAEAWLVQCQIVDWLKERQYPAPDQFGVRLSLEEGLMNAIKHGNRGDLSKSVRVFCEVTDARTYIEIHDQGVGFDPAAVPDPLAEENLEKASGRGLLLMRQFMSKVEFRDHGRLLVLEKHRTPE